jgi:hypothetical protein
MAAVAATPASATVVLQRWQKLYELTDCQCDVLRPEVEALIDGGHINEQIAAMEADIKTQVWQSHDICLSSSPLPLSRCYTDHCIIVGDSMI